MIELGNYNTLSIVRNTSVGLFLSDEEGTELLLPNKYVPETYEMDSEINVFCYLDHEERPIATSLHPLVIRNEFAVLKVADVNDYGAFMDWGLEKHLLVPYREQSIKLREGYSYIVHCYMDEKSFRLVGTTKLDKFLDNTNLTVEEQEEVDLIVSRKTDLGLEVIVNQKHKGLVFLSDIFKKLEIGDSLKGYIKNIRDDNKLDVSITPIGHKKLEPTANEIYEKLVELDGFLPLNDKSNPEEIRNILQMSKKNFKKGVGNLYKEKKIKFVEGGIELLSS